MTAEFEEKETPKNISIPDIITTFEESMHIFWENSFVIIETAKVIQR